MENLRLAILTAAVVSTILGSAFLLGLVRPVSSASPSAFEYKAKWICNAPIAPAPFLRVPFVALNATSAENIGLVPGEYKTDINIYNPSQLVNLTLFMRFVVSSPGFTSARMFTRQALFAGNAFILDCRAIHEIFATGEPGIPGIILCPKINVTCAVKGFVTIDEFTSGALVAGFSSSNGLNVVGEYSSESYAPASSTSSSDFCIFQFNTGPCSSTGTSLNVVPITATPFTS